MQFKETAAFYPTRKKIPKETQLFGQKFPQISQNFWWSEQVFTESITETQKKWFTKSKDNLFAQYYKHIIEHPNRQIHSSFRFGNISRVFSVKKFELHGNQFIVTETVNLNRRKIRHLYKKRYYVANKCEIIESNYDE